MLLSYSGGTSDLLDCLMEELDYYLLPETAWNKVIMWYGLSQNSRPLARKVVEFGKYMKHCVVEIYQFEFKLSIHPNINDAKIRSFSRADTVGDLEAALKEEFGVNKSAECRVWQCFMPHTYKLLSNKSQTLNNADLYNEWVNSIISSEREVTFILRVYVPRQLC